MEIGQFIFPFIMAVITSSIMIVAIYFLRRIPYFANLFSVWFMVILYLVCVLRLFLPLEFPDAQIILRDDTVLNAIVETLWVRVPDAASQPSVIIYVFLGVWAVGMLVFGIVSVVTHKSKKTYYLANSDFTTEEEKRVFERVSKDVLRQNDRVVLKKTDAVHSIMVIGYVKRYILLPVKDYAPDELEMILRHECTHIKNNDLWIKLLVHIYCCVFWWNPLSYLLKHDLDFTLEMRCDLSATKNFSDDEREVYFDTLKANCPKSSKQEKKGKTKRKDKKKDSKDHSYFFICAELSKAKKNKEFVRRMKAIAKDPPKKAGQITANALVVLGLVAVFVVSYFFILQPFYGYEADVDDYGLNDGAIVVDETNGYLVKQEDGTYLFFYGSFPPEVISKEDVEQGLYDDFPILEN